MRYRLFFGVMAWGAASFALAAPLTPAQQAFADAQALAQSAQANAVSNLSTGGVSSTVNQFNPTYYNSNGTAPESTLFQGGNGNTVSAGQTKVADCQNDAPNPDPFLRQNCEAINLMVNNPANMPQIAIPSSLFAASRAIEAQGVTDPNAAGSFTSCVNKTVGSLPTTEICNEWFGTDSQQCTMGRVVVVDAYTSYQCDKTATTYLPQSCDKTLNVMVTQPAPSPARVIATPLQGTWSVTSVVSSWESITTCNTNGATITAYGFGSGQYGESGLNYSCTAQGCYLVYYSSDYNSDAWSSSQTTAWCPSGFTYTYSCPAGTTLTGTGSNSTCIYPAVVSSSTNNGCSVLEAAAL